MRGEVIVTLLNIERQRITHGDDIDLRKYDHAEEEKNFARLVLGYINAKKICKVNTYSNLNMTRVREF